MNYSNWCSAPVTCVSEAQTMYSHPITVQG